MTPKTNNVKLQNSNNQRCALSLFLFCSIMFCLLALSRSACTWFLACRGVCLHACFAANTRTRVTRAHAQHTQPHKTTNKRVPISLTSAHYSSCQRDEDEYGPKTKHVAQRTALSTPHQHLTLGAPASGCRNAHFTTHMHNTHT